MFTCAKILKLIIYVSQRLFINLVVQRHACIVFLPNPPIAMFESRIGNFPKTLLLVSWEKIQYTDGERPDL